MNATDGDTTTPSQILSGPMPSGHTIDSRNVLHRLLTLASTNLSFIELERLERVNHVTRGVRLDQVLVIEIGIITPDGRIAGDRTRKIEYVVGVSVTDCCLRRLDSRIEVVSRNDLDVLKQEVNELYHSVQFHSRFLHDQIFVVFEFLVDECGRQEIGLSVTMSSRVFASAMSAEMTTLASMTSFIRRIYSDSFSTRLRPRSSILSAIS